MTAKSESCAGRRDERLVEHAHRWEEEQARTAARTGPSIPHERPRMRCKADVTQILSGFDNRLRLRRI
jgi:hypothetical protein